MKKKNGVTYSTAVPVISRRQRVIDMRIAQLKSGVKMEKIDGKTTDKEVPLTAEDKVRINKELEVLRSRLHRSSVNNG